MSNYVRREPLPVLHTREEDSLERGSNKAEREGRFPEAAERAGGVKNLEEDRERDAEDRQGAQADGVKEEREEREQGEARGAERNASGSARKRKVRD